MAIDFRLPSLGADMETATLTQWLKQPGEQIRRGEAVAVVETAKGLIDIESFDDGILESVVVQPGTKVPVGAILARLSGEASSVHGPAVLAVASPSAAGAASPRPAIPAPMAPPPADLLPVHAAGRVRISPAARRRAQELGLTLETLAERAGSGIVHIEDVERLAAAAVPQTEAMRPAGAAAGADTADARSAMRIAIGNAMARAKREIPHYYLAHSVDFGPARAWLERYNAQLPVKARLIEGVLITKAVALAAARVEGFNGFFREGRFEPAAAVNIGTAIALRGGGLVAPALLDAAHKDLATLMHEFSDLVARVRAGHMRSGEFAAATITVTSLGSEGVEELFPIINPPQVAIVGTGSATERPWVHEGGLLVRPVLTLTLAADHRVTDGRAGSRFVHAIAELLAKPESL
jgi:pyruvate dehydrogenase E2 component (dihydrolipoamide acetyltransferase)